MKIKMVVLTAVISLIFCASVRAEEFFSGPQEYPTNITGLRTNLEKGENLDKAMELYFTSSAAVKMYDKSIPKWVVYIDGKNTYEGLLIDGKVYRKKSRRVLPGNKVLWVFVFSEGAPNDHLCLGLSHLWLTKPENKGERIIKNVGAAMGSIGYAEGEGKDKLEKKEFGESEPICLRSLEPDNLKAGLLQGSVAISLSDNSWNMLTLYPSTCAPVAVPLSVGSSSTAVKENALVGNIYAVTTDFANKQPGHLGLSVATGLARRAWADKGSRQNMHANLYLLGHWYLNAPPEPIYHLGSSWSLAIGTNLVKDIFTELITGVGYSFKGIYPLVIMGGAQWGQVKNSDESRTGWRGTPFLGIAIPL